MSRHTDYWARKKDKINAARREKYRNDSEYRESVLASNRKVKKQLIEKDPDYHAKMRAYSKRRYEESKSS